MRTISRLDERLYNQESRLTYLLNLVDSQKQTQASLQEFLNHNNFYEITQNFESRLRNVETIQSNMANSIYIHMIEPQFKSLQQEIKRLQADMSDIKILQQEIKRLQADMSDIKILQQAIKGLQADMNDINELKKQMIVKADAGKTVQTPLPIEKPAAILSEPKENAGSVKPIKNNSNYPFLKDYCQLDDKDFKKKYQCKEVDFYNFQDVRNGDANTAEFTEGQGNYYLFTINTVNYLLPLKFFLENQNSRMQVLYFYEVDYDNKGQLLSDQIISPAVIKKRDLKTWVCVEKGKIGR